MNDSKINLKAFAVGNGLSDTRLNDNSMIYFAYYHGIFGQHIWMELQKYCCSRGACNFHDPSDSHCKKALAAAQQVMSDDLNNYDIYTDCDGCSSSLGSQAKTLLRKFHPNIYPSGSVCLSILNTIHFFTIVYVLLFCKIYRSKMKCFYERDTRLNGPI